MPSNLFAVILNEGHEKGMARLRKAYPEHSQIYTDLGDNVFIVTGDTRTNDVAEAAGLTRSNADEGIRGAVFKLNGSFAGYTKQTLWEWIENAEEGT